MMKKLYFGSNLKMYKNAKETANYLQKLYTLTKDISREEAELFILPSYTSLGQAARQIDQSYIRLGAQNMCWEDQGQFTGEISPLMLEELQISLVMVGHSERRHLFRENNYEEGRKIACALRHGFTALLCVGETEQEKEYGISEEIIRMQLKTGLYGAAGNDWKKLLVAYEPVWAIGVNGRPATAEYAQHIHSVIRNCLVELFGGRGQDIPLLYGGSVNPGNANAFIAQPDVDGLYVGRAAWDADQFNSLIRDAINTRKSLSLKSC